MAILFILLVIIGSHQKFFPFLDAFLGKYGSFLKKVILVLAFLSPLFLFDLHLQKDVWERALDLLWIILFLPILAKVGNMKLAKKLMPWRKEIGILMGMFGIVHALPTFLGAGFAFVFTENFWMNQGVPTFLAFGMIAVIISTLLLITSNILSMKLLGTKWKILHRLAYLLAFLVVVHVAFLGFVKTGTIDPFDFSILILFIIGKICEWRKVSFFK